MYKITARYTQLPSCFFLTLFQVVRGKGNTLNNRFLPLRNIETDAVLSLDDDVCFGTPSDCAGIQVSNPELHTKSFDQAAYYMMYS